MGLSDRGRVTVTEENGGTGGKEEPARARGVLRHSWRHRSPKQSQSGDRLRWSQRDDGARQSLMDDTPSWSQGGDDRSEGRGRVWGSVA